MKWLWQLVNNFIVFAIATYSGMASLFCVAIPRNGHALTMESVFVVRCWCTYNCLHISQTLTHRVTHWTSERHSEIEREREVEQTVAQFKHFTRFINRLLYQNRKTFDASIEVEQKRANANGSVFAIPFVRLFKAKWNANFFRISNSCICRKLVLPNAKATSSIRACDTY